MSKNIQILTRLFIALVIIVIGNYVIVAQRTHAGDWKAQTRFVVCETEKDNFSAFFDLR